jgi:hypothetical protein
MRKCPTAHVAELPVEDTDSSLPNPPWPYGRNTASVGGLTTVSVGDDPATRRQTALRSSEKESGKGVDPPTEPTTTPDSFTSNAAENPP